MGLVAENYKIDKNYCGRCNQVVVPTIISHENGPHDKEARCPGCNKYLYWMPKTKNQYKLDKRPKKYPSPKKLGIEYCQICLRKKENVKRKYLSTHHVDHDPKNDDRLNLFVVCIACHTLIGWTQTYLRDND